MLTGPSAGCIIQWWRQLLVIIRLVRVMTIAPFIGGDNCLVLAPADPSLVRVASSETVCGIWVGGSAGAISTISLPRRLKYDLGHN